MSVVKIISLLASGSTQPPISFNNAVIVCDGNSLTHGNGVSLPYPTQLAARVPFNSNGADVYNFGVGAQTTPQMISDAATQVDPLYNPGLKSIVIAWEIGNDIYFNGNVSNAYDNFVDYCQARRAVGWKVIVITLPPRDQSTVFGDNSAQFETKLQAANSLLLANWNTFADAIIDTRSDSRLAAITPSYWNIDNVHLNNAGYGVIVDMIMDVILTL